MNQEGARAQRRLNQLLAAVHVPIFLESLDDCVAALWIPLVESMLQLRLPGIERSPGSQDARRRNLELLLAFLGNVVGLSLTHILPDALFKRAPGAVADLAELLYTLGVGLRLVNDETARADDEIESVFSLAEANSESGKVVRAPATPVPGSVSPGRKRVHGPEVLASTKRPRPRRTLAATAAEAKNPKRRLAEKLRAERGQLLSRIIADAGATEAVETSLEGLFSTLKNATGPPAHAVPERLREMAWKKQVEAHRRVLRDVAWQRRVETHRAAKSDEAAAERLAAIERAGAEALAPARPAPADREARYALRERHGAVVRLEKQRRDAERNVEAYFARRWQQEEQLMERVIQAYLKADRQLAIEERALEREAARDDARARAQRREAEMTHLETQLAVLKENAAEKRAADAVAHRAAVQDRRRRLRDEKSAARRSISTFKVQLQADAADDLHFPELAAERLESRAGPSTRPPPRPFPRNARRQ